MERKIKLKEGQLTKISQLKTARTELEMQLALIIQRQQDIVDLIAEYEGIENIEKVDFKDNLLVFTMKDKK